MTPPTVEPALFQRVRTTRAFEEVSAQIRRLVTHGRLKPGDRLPTERELALELGVSRNTVREAMRGLEMAGVLKSTKTGPNGAFVVAPDGQIVATALRDMVHLGSVTPKQLTDARVLITENVVKLVCARMTDEGFAELERNVESSWRASEAGDQVGRSRTNLEFHKILARHTGNPIFIAIMEGLIQVMQHFLDTLGPPGGDEVYASRARFIERLRARDADGAIAEMTAFLHGTHRHYLSKFGEEG